MGGGSTKIFAFFQNHLVIIIIEITVLFYQIIIGQNNIRKNVHLIWSATLNLLVVAYPKSKIKNLLRTPYSMILYP